ncbi:MAG: DNA translocase FtsK 4TM domain-containing protein, partial [Chloroflexi bacterium]|nr:DNA translocase FtsK 4TM domain-containing protein [Chloroflexota bacterium]
MAARKPASKSKAAPRPDALQRLTTTLARAEVGGVILILLSAVTLLSLLTRSNGIITAALINALQTLFGIGVWGFPLVTGTLGFWMVIRAIEQLPDLPWQRPAGLATLFLAAIIGATLWMQPEQEGAGGQVGLLLATGLQNVIGSWGAWLFVGFLMVIGVILLTDQWLPNTTVDLWYLGQEWRQQKTLRPPVAIQPPVPLPSGHISWWKRLLEGWQGTPLANAMPVQSPLQNAPNLV